MKFPYMTIQRPKRDWRWYLKVWINGRHSNIPQCCTLWFYVRVWLRVPEFIVAFKTLYLFIDWKGRNIPEMHQYVRCPVCRIRGRFNEMHLCNDRCGGVYPTG